MNCMKCGRETAAEQVFCEDCLLDMERYPVKPGTAVQLPKRMDVSTPKKTPPKRRGPSLEEQVKSLKKRVRLLTAGLILALLLAAALGFYTLSQYLDNTYAPGQNYSSIVIPTDSPESTEAAAP